MHTGDTINARASVLYQATNATGITFIGASDTTFAAQDYVILSGQNDQITFNNTHWTTIDDTGQGTRMALDGSTTITIKDFQYDLTGKIDLYHTGYASAADMMAHEVVDFSNGPMTTFTSPFRHGEPILTLIGDVHVMPDQVIFHS
jgi:hypothetical protein